MEERYIGLNREYAISLFLKYTIFLVVMAVSYLIMKVFELFFGPLDLEMSSIILILLSLFYLIKQLYLLIQAIRSRVLFHLIDTQLLVYGPYSNQTTINNIANVKAIALKSQRVVFQELGPIKVWFPTYENYIILNQNDHVDLKIIIHSSPKYAADCGEWLSEKLNIPFTIDSRESKLANYL